MLCSRPTLSTGHVGRWGILYLALILLLWSPAPLVAQDLSAHLTLLGEMAQQAIAASQAAEQAATVADVKAQADRVFALIWGTPSGITVGTLWGGAHAHGWKTRWQVDTDDFELEDPEKFGVLPPDITDPTRLGIVGLGRHVRKQVLAQAEAGGSPHHAHVAASLSNVIGWMRIDDAPARGGMPRVDLTYQWDAPSAFWQSTADTGWIMDAYAQALNILKVDYGDDLASARTHAADLTRLLQRAITGVDANGDGSIAPAMMEGGLHTALQHAGFAGLLKP